MMPRVITRSRSTTGVAVRPFGKVILPSASINECCHSIFPSGVNDAKIPCVPWKNRLPVSGSIVGLEEA